MLVILKTLYLQALSVFFPSFVCLHERYCGNALTLCLKTMMS